MAIKALLLLGLASIPGISAAAPQNESHRQLQAIDGCGGYDFDSNGVVDIEDLLILLEVHRLL
jgi:hypothetical protein